MVSVIWLGSPGLAGAMSVVEAAGGLAGGGATRHPQAGDEDRLGEGLVVHVAAGEPAVHPRLEGVQAPDGAPARCAG